MTRRIKGEGELAAAFFADGFADGDFAHGFDEEYVGDHFVSLAAAHIDAQRGPVRPAAALAELFQSRIGIHPGDQLGMRGCCQ